LPPLRRTSGEWPDGYVHRCRYQRSGAHRRQNCEGLIEKAAIGPQYREMTEAKHVVSLNPENQPLFQASFSTT
jgi:hypothetical protein